MIEDQDFPKIIWRYWHQGWDAAPVVVRHCSESVRHYAPDWRIIDLDRESIKNYIELPEKLLKEPDFPLATLSDLIRAKLLTKYGGCWIDATIFLNRDFSGFIMPLMKSKFFAFFRHKGFIAFSSWFLASKKSSYVSQKIAEEFEKLITSDQFIERNRKYFKKWRGSPNYFSFHRLFESFIEKDEEYRQELEAMPFMPSYPVMSSIYYGWNKDIASEHMSNILHDAPMLKFSHSVRNINRNSALMFAMKRMHGQELMDFPHLHVSSGLRTTELFNSFVNDPSVVGRWAGQFESQRDLRLCNESYPHYHVYNFASTSGQHGAQLLVPHDSNRMFLRFQQGEGYSEAREVAFIDDNIQFSKRNLTFYDIKSPKTGVSIRDLEKRLIKVEKRVYPLRRIWRHIKKLFF